MVTVTMHLQLRLHREGNVRVHATRTVLAHKGLWRIHTGMVMVHDSCRRRRRVHVVLLFWGVLQVVLNMLLMLNLLLLLHLLCRRTTLYRILLLI